MDGVTTSILALLITQQFYTIYKLGKLEERLKKLENNFTNSDKYGKKLV